MKTLIALFCLLLACVRLHARQPNIVLIFMEDMGPHIGPYGDSTAATPSLNRLASEGCVYTRGAKVTAASCAPSRASLFTGLYPHQNGVFGFVHSDGFYLRPGIPNYVKFLHEAGYRTGITYKTGIDPSEDLAFEEAYAAKSNDDRPDERDGEVSNCIDNVRLFLKSQPKNQSFYLQAQTSDTHSPWDDERRHHSIREGSPGWPYPPIDKSRIQAGNYLGADFRLDDDTRELLAGYYGAVQRADYFVGAVLDALQEFGFADDTLVVFPPTTVRHTCCEGKAIPTKLV